MGMCSVRGLTLDVDSQGAQVVQSRDSCLKPFKAK